MDPTHPNGSHPSQWIPPLPLFPPHPVPYREGQLAELPDPLRRLLPIGGQQEPSVGGVQQEGDGVLGAGGGLGAGLGHVDAVAEPDEAPAALGPAWPLGALEQLEARAGARAGPVQHGPEPLPLLPGQGLGFLEGFGFPGGFCFYRGF